MGEDNNKREESTERTANKKSSKLYILSPQKTPTFVPLLLAEWQGGTAHQDLRQSTQMAPQKAVAGPKFQISTICPRRMLFGIKIVWAYAGAEKSGVLGGDGTIWLDVLFVFCPKCGVGIWFGCDGYHILDRCCVPHWADPWSRRSGPTKTYDRHIHTTIG